MDSPKRRDGAVMLFFVSLVASFLVGRYYQHEREKPLPKTDPKMQEWLRSGGITNSEPRK